MEKTVIPMPNLKKFCLPDRWLIDSLRTRPAKLFDQKKELNIFVSIGRVTARENETTGVNQQDSKLIYKTPQDAAQLISKCQWGRRRSRRSRRSADGSTTSSPLTQKKPRHWRGSSCKQ